MTRNKTGFTTRVILIVSFIIPMCSVESNFQYVKFYKINCGLLFLAKVSSALDLAIHSGKELSFVVPAVLLPLLLVVAQAASVPAIRAQARLHPSRPCQRTKQCSGVAAGNAPKTTNKGPAPERAHPLAILKNPHTYSEARQEPNLHLYSCTAVRE